jgi:hypothetical protein
MIIGIVVVVAVIAVVIAVIVNVEKRKSARLRSRFGEEYDLVLRETGSRRKADAVLESRVKRIEHLKIRDLTEAERARYLVQWQDVQVRFIDHPRGAVTEADELVESVLIARGFPTSEFDQRAADISVHHAELVGPYRHASLIASRAGRNEATTEELRGALIEYRSLFDSLLGVSVPVERAQVERRLAS